MYLFIVALHVLLSLMLILIIILQPGKGGGVGAAFGGGGGGSGLFGPRGPTSLLARATTFVAVGFMVTSITLAWYSDRTVLGAGESTGDIIEELERQRKEKADAPEAEPEADGEAPPAEEPEAAGDAEPAGEEAPEGGAEDAAPEGEAPAEGAPEEGGEDAPE